MHLILFDHIIQLDSLAPVIDLLSKEKKKDYYFKYQSLV